MSQLSAKIPHELKAKLETAAAEANMSLSEFLRKHLPSLVERGLELNIGETRKGEPQVMVEPRRKSGFAEEIMGTYQEAIKIKTMMQVLGIDLTGGSQQKQPYQQAYGGYPQLPQQQKSEEISTKDMMNQIAMIQMISNMKQETKNPEMKTFLERMENLQKDTLEKLTNPPQGKEMNLEDLMKWMAILKMTGQPEEAQKVQEMFNQRMAQMQKDMYDAKLAMQQQQSDFQKQWLQKELEEIKNAPSELDQITRLSALAESDPAIKKYLHAKLGIEEKEKLTPEKIGRYIENVQVPLGKLVKGVLGAIQKRKEAPAEMPPPPEEKPEVPAEEVEGLESQHLPPEPEKSGEGTYQPSAPSPPQESEPTLTPKQKARGMLSQGVPIDQITQETGLSSPQVRGIKGSMVKSGELPGKGEE